MKNKKFFNNFFVTKLHIDLILLICIILILSLSIIVTWSAIGGNEYIFQNKLIQMLLGFIIMIIFAQIPPKFYEKYAFSLYFFCILSLTIVCIIGHISKGAQRWLDLEFIKFQPSEIIKIAIPLIIAKIINKSIHPMSLKKYFQIMILIMIPTILIINEPDLGNGVLIFISGLCILFLSGLSWKIIINNLIIILLIIPISWFGFIHEYQKERIFMLFHPESDPLNRGYHIIQSKIAIGSGGLIGKGWLNGTQNQYEFLPEKSTDFIFAVLAEEFGFIGVVLLIILYTILIFRGMILALKSENFFGKITISGIISILFFYIFVNIGMVSGLLPVVGIPLPLFSYGGTSLIVSLASFGIIMSIHTHKKIIPKKDT
ncbi:rod shape-determining protein RodA [Enterobacteriaceae endosymbiont of Plateumaris consimilis]|uniref:rod shape-determining protein RodA n=1 Tax=Enterobacteriaceae endosymbiont of Plateumaris consimilis TaxID=2675794 RepID=UPI0014499F0D|nr:rod shape-determining protein RodA [Enterobacteriaceae endosymbiont of Plateumaris consimilis]QJC28701.1 rod shape-determining protein RodA [Enterobacteriaceae endosymbiont of Plateumaris consimilis]